MQAPARTNTQAVERLDAKFLRSLEVWDARYEDGHLEALEVLHGQSPMTLAVVVVVLGCHGDSREEEVREMLADTLARRGRAAAPMGRLLWKLVDIYGHLLEEARARPLGGAGPGGLV